MDESLKSLQLTHRLLMTLCIALAVLLLSSQRGPGPYEAALAELRKIDPTLEETGEMMMSAIAKDYASLGLPGWLRQAAPAVDSQGVRFTTLMTSNDKMQFSKPVFAANQPRPVDAYYEYLRLAPKWDGYDLLSPDKRQFMAAVKMLAEKNDLKTIGEVQLGQKADPAQGYQSIAGKCIIGISERTESAAPSPEGRPMFTYGFEGSEAIDCEGQRKPLSSEVVDLLLARGVVEKQGDGYAALPRLRAVWDQVKGQDIGILEDVLQRRAAEEQREREQKVDFMGLSIRSSVVLFVGPTLMVAFLLFMNSLVAHISRNMGLDPPAVRGFPWFGLASDSLGRFLLWGSVVVLPVLSGGLLIWFVGGGGPGGMALQAIFAAACAVLGARIVLATTRVAQVLASPQASEQTAP